MNLNHKVSEADLTVKPKGGQRPSGKARLNYITQNKQQHTYHPHHLPYSPQCLKIGCRDKPYWNGKIHYSLCLTCLQKEELGPFKRRHYKQEEYSTLFWLTDYENKVFNEYEKGTTK